MPSKGDEAKNLKPITPLKPIIPIGSNTPLEAANTPNNNRNSTDICKRVFKKSTRQN